MASTDAVVHAIGLLFDVQSGLQQLNSFTSASKSVPDAEGERASTYDNITRKTALLAIAALASKKALPYSESGLTTNEGTVSAIRRPFVFVSCAEAGWPDVRFGATVESAAPDWLQRYLAAKRAVEAELVASADKLRHVIVRPSLIWNWKKFDVLPIIPIFNLASAIGVPFVDKTVRVETVGKSIVAALLDEEVSGVQRFSEMEMLAQRLPDP